jgi:hypothetical protein
MRAVPRSPVRPYFEGGILSALRLLQHDEEEDIEGLLGGEFNPYLRARPEHEALRRALFPEYGLAELEMTWERKLLYAADHPGEAAE